MGVGASAANGGKAIKGVGGEDGAVGVQVGPWRLFSWLSPAV
jgi:hypothetical protein